MIGFGIVGAGNIAEGLHLPALKRCHNVAITALCDPDKERLQRLSKQYDGVRCYKRYEEMLADAPLDAVVVATPNSYHAPVTLAAFKRGLHVLCEKPLAMNYREAKQMLQAAERANVRHMIAFNYRFVPAMQYLKQLVDDGFVGDIFHCNCAYLAEVPHLWIGWRQDAKLQGPMGAFGDIGSHVVDFALHVGGDLRAVCAASETFVPLRLVQATGKMRRTKLDDATFALAKFKNGAIGVLQTSWVCMGRGHRLGHYQHVEVYGSKGTVVYHHHNPYSVFVNKNGWLVEKKVPKSLMRLPKFVERKGLNKLDQRLVYRFTTDFHFVECIAEGRNPSPSFHDGAKVQQVLDAVWKSSVTGEWATV